VGADAGLSVIFQLWEYIPYRSRNMREMQLDTNLYRRHGQWHLRFVGEQLKIGYKNGRLNEFDLPIPPRVVPYLETYLEVWRPLLLTHSADPNPYVLLTSTGRPYARSAFNTGLGGLVYSFTGKHWNPHMVRTVWATEKILAGVDFLRVAEMLNDRLETVVKRYAHLRQRNTAEEMYALIDRQDAPA
jgi:hypothetical protein